MADSRVKSFCVEIKCHLVINIFFLKINSQEGNYLLINQELVTFCCLHSSIFTRQLANHQNIQWTINVGSLINKYLAEQSRQAMYSKNGKVCLLCQTELEVGISWRVIELSNILTIGEIPGSLFRHKDEIKLMVCIKLILSRICLWMKGKTFQPNKFFWPFAKRCNRPIRTSWTLHNVNNIIDHFFQLKGF